MTRPTLSVFMPNYNYGGYIGEALQAILSQTFMPDEVIVMDDASTDNSLQIIESFIGKHPNLRLIRNEKNMGTNSAWNKGIMTCKSEYLYLAGSDDKVLPGYFEKAMGVLAEYPQAGLCFADWAMLEGGKLIEDRAYLSNKPRYFSPDEFVKVLRRNEYTVIGGISVITKRASLIKAGCYIESLGAAHDIFAHHVICFRDGACYLPEIAAVLRKHERQFSSKQFRPINVELDIVKNSMDTLLMPEYADVLPKFQATSPFSHRSWEVLKLILGTPKYRRFFSTKLLRYALFDRCVRRLLLPLLPMWAWRGILSQYKKIKSKIWRDIDE